MAREAAGSVDGDGRGVCAQPLPSATRLRLQGAARLGAVVSDADAGAAGRDGGTRAPELGGCRLTVFERRDHGVSLEGAAGTESAHDREGADVSARAFVP